MRCERCGIEIRSGIVGGCLVTQRECGGEAVYLGPPSVFTLAEPIIYQDSVRELQDRFNAAQTCRVEAVTEMPVPDDPSVRELERIWSLSE